jgi:hypothetical protein
MESAHKNLLTGNLCVICDNLSNIDSVLDHLIANRIFTDNMTEEIRVTKPTRYGKASSIVSLLMRRGPRAYPVFIDILNITGNEHIAATITGKPVISESISKPVVRPDNINMAVSKLAPVMKKCERSNNLKPKVAVESFLETFPTTQLGLSELPYLVALKLGYDIRDVCQFDDTAPSQRQLEASLQVYDEELATIEEFLKLVDEKGGFEFNYELHNPTGNSSILYKISKLVDIYPRNKIQFSRYSESQINRLDKAKVKLLIMLHMFRLGTNRSFVVRRDFEPRPSAYLIHNLTQDSPIILQEHKTIVRGEISEDECQIVQRRTMACPW